ncbi:MAG: hypothetical protein K1X74_17190 [Pirellulales bacterium]|nr:hypothetical protein [Pirellulales bacterium]
MRDRLQLINQGSIVREFPAKRLGQASFYARMPMSSEELFFDEIRLFSERLPAPLRVIVMPHDDDHCCWTFEGVGGVWVINPSTFGAPFDVQFIETESDFEERWNCLVWDWDSNTQQLELRQITIRRPELAWALGDEPASTQES